jgi:hypothetical protein
MIHELSKFSCVISPNNKQSIKYHTMKPKNLLSTAAPTLLLALALPSTAASISWSATPYSNGGVNKSEMGIDQFVQTGDHFLAVNLGSASQQNLAQSADLDILFTASDSNFSILPGLAPENNMSLLAPAGTFHDNLGGNNNISSTAAYSDVQGGETGAVHFRLHNLIIGRTYIVQNLLMDDISFITDVHFDDAYLTSYGAQGQVTGTDGVLAIGSFTADAHTQDFRIQVFDALHNPRGGHLNAIYVQSRPVPEPSTALLGVFTLGLTCFHRRRSKHSKK